MFCEIIDDPFVPNNSPTFSSKHEAVLVHFIDGFVEPFNRHGTALDVAPDLDR